MSALLVLFAAMNFGVSLRYLMLIAQQYEQTRDPEHLPLVVVWVIVTVLAALLFILTVLNRLQ